MNNASKFASLFMFSLAFTDPALAGLIDRGDGMIYDDVLNITWLQDANYAFTSGYAAANATGGKDGPVYNIQADGKMSWQAANEWAQNLSFGGFDDWRLASIKPLNGVTFSYGLNAKDGSADYGYNISSPQSELAYMFNVNLGLPSLFTAADALNPGWTFRNDTTIPGTGLMQNLKSYSYWSNMLDTRLPNHAWTFNTMLGNQAETGIKNSFYAWAVRDGDIAAKTPIRVSEPNTLTLLGLAMLLFSARLSNSAVRKKCFSGAAV